MKKLLSVLLFVLLLFAFVSCNSAQETQPDTHSNANPNSFSENPEDLAEGNTNHSMLASCNTFEEYQTFIHSHKLSSNFVLYEDISDFGTFDYFVMVSPNEYSYRLTNGIFAHQVTIISNKTTLDTTTILNSQAQADMRICPGTSQGTEKFTHNGVLYNYYNGSLRSIEWSSGGNYFELRASNSQSDFDLYDGNNTLINAILNKDTAGSVKLAFDNMMAQKAEAAK